MADYKTQLYNIALDGQGYLLAGIPQSPARKMSQAAAIGTTPNQIDLMYKDSSSFLPWVQTDWSGGFQEEKWKDTATFKNGTGLEYIEKYGQITLLNTIAAVQTIGTGYTFGASQLFNQTLLIGTKHTTLAILGALDSSDSWAALTTGWSNITAVNDIDEREGKAYLALKRSTGAEKCLQSWDSSTFADATGDADDSSEWRMVKRIESRLYASNLNSTADGDRLIYSDNGGTNWTTIITATGRNRTITQGVPNLGSLYFLIEDFPAVELWWVNDTIVTQVYRWENLTSPKIASWLGNVHIVGKESGKMRWFKWNGAVMSTMFEEKITGMVADSGELFVYKNNLHTYGLIFDGKFAFPSWTEVYGSNNNYPFTVFGGASAQAPYFYGLDGTSLKISKLNTSAYKTTGNVVMGIYSGEKPAVTKLWHSITVGFEELVSGQTVKAEYSIDDEGSWTTIGTVSPTADETEKTYYFPSNTKSKRIQLRITLTGGGANTPTVLDYIVRFLPLPEDKFLWGLTLNCSDLLILLDGKTKEAKRGSELRNLLKLTNFKNQIIEFQDIDYAGTLINDSGDITATATTITVDSTSDFPEQGRFKIEQEEILYTGKTATIFTGCTRGARGTTKAVHADDTPVDTGYDVIITNYGETNPVAVKAKTEETYVSLTLTEV